MSHNLIGVCKNYLLRKEIFKSIGDRKWNNLCKCQLKHGSLKDIPFLVLTSALFNHIMPIVSDHIRSLFISHRKNRSNQ